MSTTWPRSGHHRHRLDLLSYSQWIYFSVLAERLPDHDPYPGVTIILDKWLVASQSWELGVASAVTDADGFADLFGFGSGDFRIRYTRGRGRTQGRQL
ncbi:MAG: hypothetical protein R2717_08125 [Schumannella sp.]